MDQQLERKINQNCASDIRKVDTKIKELKNVLLRIVPTDDKHTYLLPGTPTEMALIPDMLMTYKIPCAGKNAPCIIKFAYGDKYNHVSIFISQTESMPSEKNCDTKLFSPKMFVVQDKAKGAKFENQFIYLSFLTDVKQMIMWVSITFPERARASLVKTKKVVQEVQLWYKKPEEDPFYELL